MKTPRMLPLMFLALGLSGSAVARAQAPVYTLVPAQSWVHFEVLHFNTSTIRGRIGPVEGQVMLDTVAGRGDVRLAVRTASVSTGIRVFDTRLREDDLLASTTYPEAYFVASRFNFDQGRLVSLRGEFTWRGISQPLQLDALRFVCRRDDSTRPAVETCGGDFEGEVLRSEYGATFGLPLVGDRVRLRVQVEGQRVLGPIEPLAVKTP